MIDSANPGHKTPRFMRHILIGFFTAAPLWVTWLVFDFLFGLLAKIGAPPLKALARLIRPFSEAGADWLINPSVQYALAVLFTLIGLYLLGLFATFVIGRKLINYFEDLVARLPLVKIIYNATKRFLQTLRQPPVTGQRVVLVAFPSPSMKAVGFVTKVFTDQDTGRELAAVYIPTSPNPTSGYIEILPLADVVMTDWTMEEAMTFVITGGTNAPNSVRFSNQSAAGGTL